MAYPEVFRQLIILDYLEKLETQEYYTDLQPLRAAEYAMLERLGNQFANELCALLTKREQFGYIQGFLRATALLEKDTSRALEGIPDNDIDRMEAKSWQ